MCTSLFSVPLRSCFGNILQPSARLGSRESSVSNTKFAIDVAAFAVMHDHHHVSLRVDVDEAKSWSVEEVVQCWYRVDTGSFMSQRCVSPTASYHVCPCLFFVSTQLVFHFCALTPIKCSTFSTFLKPTALSRRMTPSTKLLPFFTTCGLPV